MIDELVVICTYVLIVLIIKALMAEKGDAEESEPLAEDAFADFDQEEMDVLGHTGTRHPIQNLTQTMPIAHEAGETQDEFAGKAAA